MQPKSCSQIKLYFFLYRSVVINFVNIFVSRKKRENQNLLDSGNRDNNFPVDAALVELEALAAGPPMAIFPAASRCFGQDSPCI